jgi:protein-tyrosine phosphatase
VTDLHSHLVPGVDDGAANLAEALAALDRFVDAGVRTIVTTPHLPGSHTVAPAVLAADLEHVDEAFRSLHDAASTRHPGLALHLGREIMLDTPAPVLSDPRTRLAGGPCVLVELPLMVIPPRVPDAIASLRRNGWRPVIAHPERYRGLAGSLEQAGEWRRVGALLQVNAASLLGHYGRGAATLATALLERGWCDLVASDYHARGPLELAAAAAWLRERAGDEAVWLLLRENPQRIFAGEDPLPVAASVAPARSLLDRLLRWR